MDEDVKREIYAEVLDRLIRHLQSRTDVQNIDLMNLSGFCRNCLSKWYAESAKKRNLDVSYDEARNLIYGMPYAEWKEKYQPKASKEQLTKFNENKN